MNQDFEDELQSHPNIKVKDHPEKYKNIIESKKKNKIKYFLIICIVTIFFVLYISLTNINLFSNKASPYIYSLMIILFISFITFKAIVNYDEYSNPVFFSYLTICILMLGWTATLFHTKINEFLPGIVLFFLLITIGAFIYICREKISYVNLFIIVWSFFLIYYTYSVYKYKKI